MDSLLARRFGYTSNASIYPRSHEEDPTAATTHSRIDYIVENRPEAVREAKVYEIRIPRWQLNRAQKDFVLSGCVTWEIYLVSDTVVRDKRIK